MSDHFAVLVNLSPYYALEEGLAWIEALKGRAEQEGVHFYLALPFDLLNALSGKPIPPFLILGGQYMNAAPFTKTIAAPLLTSFGAKFVMLREREKIKSAQEGGLIPLLCIGETEGPSKEHLKQQIEEATQGVDIKGLQIVYEAPWIRTAFSRPTEQEIDQAYQTCRELVHSLLGEGVKVYCPVPIDQKEVETFIQTLHPDGFYFCDPHQLASIDEAALKAKVELARKAKEAEKTVAAAEPPKEEPKPVKKEEPPPPPEEEEAPEEEEEAFDDEDQFDDEEGVT